MIAKDNLHLMLQNRISWILFVLGIACVACQPVTSITATPTETVLATETREQPTVQVGSAIPTVTIVTTPSTTPSSIVTYILTPTPTRVETVTPLPTLLKKIGELPITGHKLAISSDGALIATIDNTSGVLSVFDVVQQEIKWQQKKEGYGFTILAISPDGNLLAAGGVEQQVFIYDMTNGGLVYDLAVPYIKIERVSFSPDSRLLAVSSTESDFVDAGVMVWDTSTGQLVDTFPSPNIVTYPPSKEDEYVLKTFQGWYVGEAIFVPNHDSLLAITVNVYGREEAERGALYFWNFDNQELMEVLKDSYGQSIAATPNGHLLVVDMGGRLRAWEIQDRVEVLEVDIEAVEVVRIAVTDKGVLAMLDRKGATTIWNLKGELIAELETDKIVDDIAFTPDGHLLIAYFVEDDVAPVEVWEINE